jgi:iron(III) transport system substrate-binding protein
VDQGGQRHVIRRLQFWSAVIRQQIHRCHAGVRFIHQTSRRLSRAWLLLIAWSLVACSGRDDREVVVYTSVDQVFAEPVLREFETRSGIRVRSVFDTEETKSTGVLNRIIAERSRPQADVFWSGDPMRPFQLIRRDLVESYAPPGASALPAYAKDPQGRWTGVSARARVLLVNSDLVRAEGPRSIKDLADPRWRGQTAIANPLFGTTTAHVAALFSAWGDAEAKRFLEAVKANGVRIASSNGEVKRLVASGEVAWGLTDTDDASEALRTGAPVSVVFPDQDELGTLLMPTSIVVLRGIAHPEHARSLVDYLASPAVEKYLAENGAHLPLQPGVAAPPALFPPQNFRAMQVDYGDLAATIERIQPWLREWTGL